MSENNYGCSKLFILSSKIILKVNSQNLIILFLSTQKTSRESTYTIIFTSNIKQKHTFSGGRVHLQLQQQANLASQSAKDQGSLHIAKPLNNQSNNARAFTKHNLLLVQTLRRVSTGGAH